MTRLPVTKTPKPYVGGAFIRSESGRVFAAHDARGAFFANIPQCSRKDLRNAVEAAAKALKGGQTHYCPAPGLPILRETCANHLSQHRGIDVHPDSIVVTPGAKPFLFYGILATCNPGDEVIYPNPGFPIYESLINFIGAKAVPSPLREEHEFRLDVEELKRLVTPKTKMIIINAPQNPTGSALTKQDLEGIAEVAIKNDIIVMTDGLSQEANFAPLFARAAAAKVTISAIAISSAADPRQPPAINFNFLSAAVDGELTVRAIQIARSIMISSTLTTFSSSLRQSSRGSLPMSRTAMPSAIVSPPAPISVRGPRSRTSDRHWRRTLASAHCRAARVSCGT